MEEWRAPEDGKVCRKSLFSLPVFLLCFLSARGSPDTWPTNILSLDFRPLVTRLAPESLLLPSEEYRESCTRTDSGGNQSRRSDAPLLP